jgi:cell division protein FtsL
MSKQITPEQTKQLFQFCRQHCVYHYDVQIELVDHLASAIEEQWEENPDLSFYDALRRTYSKFGVTGFSKIKRQKVKALRRKYSREFFKCILSFFSWPKIILTIMLTIGLVVVSQVISNKMYVFVPIYAVLFIVGCYYYAIYFPKKFSIEAKYGKTFLLLDELKAIQALGFFSLQIPLNLYNMTHFSLSKNNIWIIVGISFSVVLFCIILYAQLFVVPKKMKEHFMEDFSEFAVSK